MLNFVTITARKRRHDERSAAINQRRECYKNENWTQYRQIVKEQFMAEDQMCQVVLRETMEVLTDVSEAEFQRTMQQMASNPQMAQMLMAAQQGKLPSDNQESAGKKPGLTRAKTLKAFETAKTMQMEQIKKQTSMQ